MGNGQSCPYLSEGVILSLKGEESLLASIALTDLLFYHPCCLTSI
jgi:hypothetical protein